ncbi:MAG: protein phosphatase 2C domain-containing protein [Gammaproteobacteria bacterium]|nr:protein phosphatase 2C domain-containing protein [Gammaproteobacteria bacterium]TVQ47400.1 MAG: serine/threonine protein phosphatase [Gammaproteobacteria bacterium]
MSVSVKTYLDETRLFSESGDGRPAGGAFLLRSGQLCAYVGRSPQKDTAGEDALGVFRVGDRCWVLVVADGVGGQAGGREAALAALAAMGDALGSIGGDPQRMRGAVLDGIERANAAVLALGGGAATTLAVAEVGEDYVRPYHVGDSTVLLVGQRGRLKLQTVPHSPVGFAVEAGLLDATEAMHHELLHVISNVIGSAEMRIEVGPEMPFAARDTLLLASDGLFDNLFVEEILETIRCGELGVAMRNLQGKVARRMCGPGLHNGTLLPSKPDDLGILLFRRHSPVSARDWRMHEPATRDWLSTDDAR